MHAGVATEAEPAAVDDLAGVCHSFAPETLVVLGDGSMKAISEVAVGDRVRTTDPATGRTVVRTVTALHRNHDSDLADLVVRNGDGHESTVHTTQHHRFWDDTRHGWVETAALAAGDRLRTDDGAVASVESEHSWVGLSWMYDLTVDDIHTYYVVAGHDPILVHNCGSRIPDAILDASGKVHGTLPSPSTLSEYDPESLATLRDELQQSVQTRIAKTVELGADYGHSDRLAQEQDLISSIDKYLADH